MSDTHPIISPKHPIRMKLVPIGSKFMVQQPPRRRYKRLGLTKCQSLRATGGNHKYPKGTVNLTESLLVFKYS